MMHLNEGLSLDDYPVSRKNSQNKHKSVEQVEADQVLMPFLNIISIQYIKISKPKWGKNSLPNTAISKYLRSHWTHCGGNNVVASLSSDLKTSVLMMLPSIFGSVDLSTS